MSEWISQADLGLAGNSVLMIKWGETHIVYRSSTCTLAKTRQSSGTIRTGSTLAIAGMRRTRRRNNRIGEATRT